MKTRLKIFLKVFVIWIKGLIQITNLIILSLLLACHDSKQDSVLIKLEEKYFAKSYSLESSIVDIDTNLFKPINFIKNDTFLIVADIENKSGMVIIQDLRTGNTKTFISKGPGPSQLSSVSSLNITSDGNLLLHDVQTQRFLNLNLDSLLNEEEYFFQASRINGSNLRRDSEEAPPLKVITRALLYCDSILVCTKLTTDSLQFEFMNKDFSSLGQNFGRFPDFYETNRPDYSEEVPGQIRKTFYSFKVLGNLFNNKIRLNKFHGKLLVTYPTANLIEIYDLETLKMDRRMVGPKGSYPTKMYYHNGNGFPLKDSNFGYNAVDSSKKYIFLLFSGKKNSDIGANLCRVVHVIDWSGAPVAKLMLDREVQSIQLDEKEGKLYTLSMDEDHPIAKYELPDELL